MVKYWAGIWCWIKWAAQQQGIRLSPSTKKPACEGPPILSCKKKSLWFELLICRVSEWSSRAFSISLHCALQVFIHTFFTTFLLLLVARSWHDWQQLVFSFAGMSHQKAQLYQAISLITMWWWWWWWWCMARKKTLHAGKSVSVMLADWHWETQKLTAKNELINKLTFIWFWTLKIYVLSW
jgi:hypothetical protein